MKNYTTIGACLVNGRAKCLVPAWVSKTLLFLSVALIVLAAIGGCAEIPSPQRDQPISQFSVYFNNDDLAGNTTACDAVFPVPRSSMSTTNGAAAALEALFTGPTPCGALPGLSILLFRPHCRAVETTEDQGWSCVRRPARQTSGTYGCHFQLWKCGVFYTDPENSGAVSDHRADHLRNRGAAKDSSTTGWNSSAIKPTIIAIRVPS